LLTAVGLALLLSFRTPSQPLARGTRSSLAPLVGQPPGASPAALEASPTNEAASPSPAPATPSSAQAGNGTVTGPAVQNPYGEVQVQVTLVNGKITQIVALKLPKDLFRSAVISQEAEPLLREEALQAQSAQIDLLSGATYTSEAYVESLQGALDQAHG
jgi:uncharacterized protein with FMN-binding domain